MENHCLQRVFLRAGYWVAVRISVEDVVVKRQKEEQPENEFEFVDCCSVVLEQGVDRCNERLITSQNFQRSGCFVHDEDFVVLFRQVEHVDASKHNFEAVDVAILHHRENSHDGPQDKGRNNLKAQHLENHLLRLDPGIFPRRSFHLFPQSACHDWLVKYNR